MAVPTRGRIVIVGGGPAAAASAVALREIGHDGELIVISDEGLAPYSKPPLSKAFLTGGVRSADLSLGTADAELRLGTRVSRVHFDSRSVELDDKSLVPYDGLVLAVGMRVRRPAATGVEVLATMSDATRVANALRTSRSVLVVGSGFLAYELASAARAAGAETTLVIKPGALSARYGVLEAILTMQAESAGVHLVRSTNCEFRNGGATTAEGIRLEADLVLAAIGSEFERGIAPSDASHGLLVDNRCRMRDGVVAAGDATVTRLPNGLLRRDATWTNALLQGAAAARALLDDDASPYSPMPYAWTESFGLEVKVAGTPPVDVRPTVVDGTLDEARALLRWPGGAAAIGYRIPVGRLKALAADEPATLDA
ncbi:FAD-dependent oxidoreductase [Leucobacter sp. Z1108]|uniref:FAD-dependent oxidoreductase n=1 Tax=Leucobacter sp. Z1108 TaxID=3439066 RepID=UPI003F3E29C9